MSALTLDPRKTALVLIDLQHGIVGLSPAPHPATEIVGKSARLAAKFRELGAPVVLVRVTPSADGKDFLNLPVDAPGRFNAAAMPANWAEIVPEMNQQPSDIVIIKRQWGAFYGTELDLQLRRRGITTIVLGGIATNIGVESTARSANEHGYAQVFAEDAMGTFSPEMHEFAIKNIFPRLGLVRSTDAVLAALG